MSWWSLGRHWSWLPRTACLGGWRRRHSWRGPLGRPGRSHEAFHGMEGDKQGWGRALQPGRVTPEEEQSGSARGALRGNNPGPGGFLGSRVPRTSNDRDAGQRVKSAWRRRLFLRATPRDVRRTQVGARFCTDGLRADLFTVAVACVGGPWNKVASPFCGPVCAKDCTGGNSCATRVACAARLGPEVVCAVQRGAWFGASFGNLHRR